MSSRTLTISFTPSGSGAQTYSTQYRVMGTNSYSIGPTGSASPIVIYGMATGVNYEGILSTACASGGNGSDVYFTTYTPTGLVTVENNVSGSSFDMVSKFNNTPLIAINTGSFPLAYAESLDGNVSGYTGQIKISISGSFAACNGNLYVNGVFKQSVAVTAAGSYLFTSDTYISTNDLTISLDHTVGS